jgi:MerR family transcriptional regulator, thiopeptide resistance regulator
MMEIYTVRQLARLDGISVRALHYYDQIGLLPPSNVGVNGYRYYEPAAVLRLQQILFYKELGLSLIEIQQVLDQPDFDVLRALESHRRALQQRVGRLRRLIGTVDKTIEHLKGDNSVTGKALFGGFSDEEQQRYEREAARRWGDTVVESSRRWKAYTAERKAEILAEAGAIYEEAAAHLEQAPESPAVQALIGRWHQNLRHFYEPTPDILRGLGQTYSNDPEFAAFFAKIDARLAGFMTEAIEVYCQE